MSLDRMDKQLARLNSLSERVFGEPAEVDPAEAEQLLRSAGIDPARLKDALYQRILARSEKYSRAGQQFPPVFTEALEDLRPDSEKNANETTSLIRTASLDIAQLLREIGELPKLLGAGVTPSFTAAYRNRTELSARDKVILDGVAEEFGKKRHE